MPFITKLDFSNNRQVKQDIETSTKLSGGTIFGVPFSYLPVGPDLTTTGVTQTLNNIISTFSGNSGTTIFHWGDTRMSLGQSSLNVITPSNSGTTQYSTPVFASKTTTVIDGNTVSLTYSGISYNVSVTSMTNSGGAYSGTLISNYVYILSANTIDFKNRTIWVDVSGITRTNKLIINNNPSIGSVWTCIDGEGMGVWSGMTGDRIIFPVYTPSSTADSFGNQGNITRDENYIYVKTESGWKRASLSTF